MKRFKFNLLIILSLFMPFIFSAKAYADAVVINFKKPSRPGHMSVISQDKNGRWFYFYWGNNAAYEKEVPANCMKNINTYAKMTSESMKMASVILAVLPILCVYPFLQKYFVKGMYTGSVKG